MLPSHANSWRIGGLSLENLRRFSAQIAAACRIAASSSGSLPELANHISLAGAVGLTDGGSRCAFRSTFDVIELDLPSLRLETAESSLADSDLDVPSLNIKQR